MNFNYKELIDIVKSKNLLKRILVMTIGILIMAFSYNIFIVPHNIVIGGTSGLAIIFKKIFSIKPFTFLIISETLLIILSLITLGPKKASMNLIGAILYPIFVSITEKPSIYLAEKFPITDMIIITVLAGFFYGFGSAIVYKTGFSTGGSDTITQIITEYLKIPSGVALFIVNVIIILLGTFVFGIEQTVYSVLIVLINSKVIDKIMLGISDSKAFYIITNKPKEIKGLISTLKTGYTVIKSTGGYTKEDNEVIMCILHTRDYYMFKNLIEEIDPNSFIIITDCYEVYGGKRKEISTFI